MPQPNRFWRLSFDSGDLVAKMIADGALILPVSGIRSDKYDPEKCVTSRMKAGDGVFLGKLDPDLGTGRIVAIGILRNDRPATMVSWKSVRRDVFPSSQGGLSAWREQCFLFNEKPAERYNLAGEFRQHFPNE